MANLNPIRGELVGAIKVPGYRSLSYAVHGGYDFGLWMYFDCGYSHKDCLALTFYVSKTNPMQMCEIRILRSQSCFYDSKKTNNESLADGILERLVSNSSCLFGDNTIAIRNINGRKMIVGKNLMGYTMSKCGFYDSLVVSILNEWQDGYGVFLANRYPNITTPMLVNEIWNEMMSWSHEYAKIADCEYDKRKEKFLEDIAYYNRHIDNENHQIERLAEDAANALNELNDTYGITIEL